MYKILRKFIKYVLICLYETVIPCKLAPMNLRYFPQFVSQFLINKSANFFENQNFKLNIMKYNPLYLGQVSEIERVVRFRGRWQHTATHPVVHSNGRRH